MAAQKGQFVWYELSTSDPDAAQAFYSDVLGWTVAPAEVPGMDYRICSGAEGGVSGIMELTAEMQRGEAVPSWSGYIAVDDLDDAIAYFVGSGGDLYVEPMDVPNFGCFALLGDPQNVPIHVVRVTDDGGNACHPTAIGHCAWNELATSDYEAAIEFYSGGFGWERGDEIDMGSLGNYQLLSVNGQGLVGVMPTFEGGPPPMWRFYFRVPALAAAIDKIKGGGGTLIHGPQQVPGGDQIVVALDPQGAMFCLVATGS